MDIRDIEKALREQGWQVTRTEGSERLYVSPSGARVVFSGTPSDRRSILNAIATLRGAGFVWPWTARQRRAARKERRKQ